MCLAMAGLISTHRRQVVSWVRRNGRQKEGGREAGLSVSTADWVLSQISAKGLECSEADSDKNVGSGVGGETESLSLQPRLSPW